MNSRLAKTSVPYLHVVEKDPARAWEFIPSYDVPLPPMFKRHRATDPDHRELFVRFRDALSDLKSAPTSASFLPATEFAVRKGVTALVTNLFMQATVSAALAAWNAAVPPEERLAVAVTFHTGWEGLEDIDEPGVTVTATAASS